MGGKKEGEGPLGPAFDELVPDASFAAEGCASWEDAESRLQQRCIRRCLRKAGVTARQVELAFAGDLQAQCTASSYTMRALGVPFAGVYGACSTMAESLCLAAALPPPVTASARWPRPAATLRGGAPVPHAA